MLEKKIREEIFHDFIHTRMARKAAYKKKFQIKGNSIIFSVQKLVALLGLLCVAIAIVGAVLIPDFIGMIIWLALFSVLGIPLLFTQFFVKLYLDVETITYRNSIGIKKKLYWKDVKSVYFRAGHGGDLLICSHDNTIKVLSLYKGAAYIQQLISQLVPEAYGIERALLVRKSKEFKTVDGVAVFKIQTALKVLVLILVCISLTATILAAIEGVRQSLATITVFSLWNIVWVLITPYIFFTRLAVNENRISYRYWFCKTKNIRWEDIESVRHGKGGRWIKAFSEGYTMTISRNFAGYDLIVQIVSQRCQKTARRKKVK